MSRFIARDSSFSSLGCREAEIFAGWLLSAARGGSLRTIENLFLLVSNHPGAARYVAAQQESAGVLRNGTNGISLLTVAIAVSGAETAKTVLRDHCGESLDRPSSVAVKFSEEHGQTFASYQHGRKTIGEYAESLVADAENLKKRQAPERNGVVRDLAILRA